MNTNAADPKATSKTNPRENANIFSVLFFTYTLDMFRKGCKKNFEAEDLYEPLSADRSELLVGRLEKNWNKQKNPKLLRVLVRTFWPEYLYLTVLLVFMETFQILNPIALGHLLEYFKEDSEMSHDDALWYGSFVVVVNACNALLVNQYMIDSYHYGMRVRAACCAFIYRKALKLSGEALGEMASGKLVNLMSNDVNRFDYVSYFISYMIVSPFTLLVVSYFLWAQTGYWTLAGLIPIFTVFPIYSVMGCVSSRYRRRVAKCTDERIRLMDEIISGIQVIKMYTWEKPFGVIIRAARYAEINLVKKLAYCRGLFMALHLTTSRCALFFTLVALTLSGTKLSPATVFIFMCYFNILSDSVSSYFCRGITELSELSVIISRIDKFLHQEEHTYNVCEDEKVQNLVSVIFRNASVVIKQEKILSGINLNVNKGSLLGVVGTVGCGKSSLLKTILGENKVSSGDIFVNSSISYAPQEPWLFSGTIRQNILFGQAYQEDKYQEVLKVCALDKDFHNMQGGDQCHVGERGISLSGGQKARINLARALYREADIYLLDDPLSAVDINVAKHIFDNCIKKYLKDKTRILVTHQVDYLEDADEIIIMDNGEITSRGDFDSVANLMKAKRVKCTEAVEEAPKETHHAQSIPLKNDLLEQTSKGQIKGSLLFKYLSSGNTFMFFFVALLFLLSQTFVSGLDYFVSYWVSSQYEDFISIYSILIFALLVISILRSILFFKLASWSSKKMHTKMFDAIVNTKMRFFNVNPSGRILNRFSRDLNAIDENLPRAIMDAAQIILNLLGALILVILSDVHFLIPVAIIGTIFMILRMIFLKSSKNIKRLESIMRSPVFSHLNATLQGLTTIRAYDAQNMLIDEFDQHQNVHTSAWYMYITASSAFGFYLDLICCIFTALVTFSFLELVQTSAIGKIGLAITQTTSLTGVVQWGMRQSAEVTNQLMSAERIFEYRQLPSEKDKNNKPLILANWPSDGKIEFKHLNMKYSEKSNLVLKDVSLSIDAKEKIGIVGRTGSGKSSIIQSLFRLALIDGGIEIDGIDTQDIDLSELRKHISIIPQDPVLFSGSLRYNLDPFGEATDTELWRALEDVELKNTKLVSNLDIEVMDRGANFSVGQRQLICLARAIIRNNKILVLDEATANIDRETDALIQKTIRRKFSECTVLTIAHRLNTIMDSDRILVMDSGQVIEFDSIANLLQNTKSHFYQMALAMGMI
ncbi:PREDICTED: probable multidrug resistance-associated protein lethal(2)03659 [Nicrophorus vespilloides]|uniref:Probable multidrug resistance-associated protein lethal(2)03659 n=1 Tax=Nicrophorus vespilloides TaxID=110193 RepID=A0ABM1M2R3_NICVS|nr:PREDICTED: probable multidrug resistance-associated protein lethal(2)03659 [Nicrophorus vespilloides]